MPRKRTRYVPYKPALGQALTERERKVISVLCLGSCQKGICRSLGISHSSVSEHIRRMKLKTGAKNLAQLGIWARDNGYADPVGVRQASEVAHSNANPLVINQPCR